MIHHDELLKLVIEREDDWPAYLEPLPLKDIRDIRGRLDELVSSLGDLQERVTAVLETTDHQIKQRELDREKRLRCSRQKQIRISLRAYLTQPLSQEDSRLDSLALCTKSGATVRLDGLAFNVGGGERIAKTVNEAKEMFTGGLEPWAGYHLHYVRDGRISSGFGWDRPFLDEVFVLVE